MQVTNNQYVNNYTALLIAKAIPEILFGLGIQYQHAFKNTYLYGSFSPINGDSFVYEIEGTSSEIFYEYIKAFSEYKKDEMKIIVIDNAGFHSLSKYDIPENISFLRIPPLFPRTKPFRKNMGLHQTIL